VSINTAVAADIVSGDRVAVYTVSYGQDALIRALRGRVTVQLSIVDPEVEDDDADDIVHSVDLTVEDAFRVALRLITTGVLAIHEQPRDLDLDAGELATIQAVIIAYNETNKAAAEAQMADAKAFVATVAEISEAMDQAGAANLGELVAALNSDRAARVEGGEL
jgi:hypothetical protein